MAIPYDANVNLEFKDGESLFGTTPAVLRITRKPERVIFFRYGFEPQEMVPSFWKRRYKAVLRPDRDEQYDIFRIPFKDLADSIRFMELFPMNVDGEFYLQQEQLMRSETGPEYTGIKGTLLYTNSYTACHAVLARNLEITNKFTRSTRYAIVFYKDNMIDKVYVRELNHPFAFFVKDKRDKVFIHEGYQTVLKGTDCPECSAKFVNLSYSIDKGSTILRYERITYFSRNKKNKKPIQEYSYSFRE